MNSRINSVKNNYGFTFAKSFGFLFVTTSIAAFLLFYIVDLMNGDTPYHSPVVVYDGYHGYYLWEIAEHPFPFLVAISFFLSLSGAFWVTIIAPKHGHNLNWQILAIPWVALILTSPVWGLIWSVNRWPPQSFLDSSVMMLFYKHDVMVGLSLGWLSGILSFPINVLSYVSVCGLLMINRRLFLFNSNL
jgi:hypothetical protein